MGLTQTALLTDKEMVDIFVKTNNLPPYASEVLLTERDCKVFEESFFNESNEVSECLMEYKKFRIANSTMTLDKFLKMCYTGKTTKAFEMTFFQRFSEEEMARINDLLSSGKVSLHNIFEKFEKNPNRNVMRYFNK